MVMQLRLTAFGYLFGTFLLPPFPLANTPAFITILCRWWTAQRPCEEASISA